MQKHIKAILAPRSIFWKLTTIFCLLLILYFSLIHPPGFQKSADWFWGNLDKLAHCFAYLVLTISWLFAVEKQKKKIVVFCFLFSLVLESIQAFIPLRHFDVGDLLANAIGCLIGYILSQKLLKINS
jgi:glycopeptide antibiotics resistance protein